MICTKKKEMVRTRTEAWKIPYLDLTKNCTGPAASSGSPFLLPLSRIAIDKKGLYSGGRNTVKGVLMLGTAPYPPAKIPIDVISVSGPDPGSGAFLTPGSRIPNPYF